MMLLYDFYQLLHYHKVSLSPSFFPDLPIHLLLILLVVSAEVFPVFAENSLDQLASIVLPLKVIDILPLHKVDFATITFRPVLFTSPSMFFELEK